MSEFEKELEKNMELGKVFHERESFDSDFLISKRDIERVFHDWQPPKPPVVVPQIVADFIEERKESVKLYGAFHEIDESYGTGTELYDWLFASVDSQELLARAWLDGYTVEKEQLFYLKSKMTGRYLRSYTGLGMDDTTLRYEEVDDRRACGFGGGTTFTQTKIDKLSIGSYEQIEVKVEEVEK